MRKTYRESIRKKKDERRFSGQGVNGHFCGIWYLVDLKPIANEPANPF
jgi:hypothetical protein